MHGGRVRVWAGLSETCSSEITVLTKIQEKQRHIQYCLREDATKCCTSSSMNRTYLLSKASSV